jgi:excisionase family DNA binding protein
VEQLIIRMASEKPGLGLQPIAGIMANLGHVISDQTVGNVRRRNGLPPAPERKRTTPWSVYLAALAESGEALVLKSDAEVSPEKAAEILGISRPLVYQRMDSGRLPFRQVGTHRRIVAALKLFEDQRRSLASALSADAEDLEENYAQPDKNASCFCANCSSRLRKWFDRTRSPGGHFGVPS